MEQVLIVDDELPILSTVGDILRDEGYEVRTATTGTGALDDLKASHSDAVLLDVWMDGMDGIEALKRIMETPDPPVVIVMSGHANIDTAVKSVRLGAYDFLEKPLSLDKLTLTVRNALDKRRLERENIDLKALVEGRSEIVGESRVIRLLREEIDRAGPTNGRVLIYGENGTGKELVARAIHKRSLRPDGPFITVNCAAIPEELIESELFGHEKGAFTGATARREGRFELAHNGTIFLDEIADMSLSTQAKVLRTLQEQEIQRVGGTKTVKIDVRVIAASNKVLEDEIREGRFREDLYYRLNVIPFKVPPLRERAEDIPQLAGYFIEEFSAEYGKKPKALAEDALELFKAYPWPGNVREMRNIIERLVIMAPGETVTAEMVPPPVRDASPSLPSTGSYTGFGSLKEAKAAFERDYIRASLVENNWNVSRTAEALQVERSNLHRKINALGIETQE
jgi:two-component system nitrogen regulation response regulator NtrX